MRIVIDTCIFFTDFRLERPLFRTLLSSINIGSDTLHIPQVVLDETINKYREKVLSCIQEVERATKKAGRQIARSLTPAINQSQLDQEVALYREVLEEKLAAVDAEILAYPSVSHQDMVLRDLLRRKPFNQEGKGYRDALIWETILNLAKNEGADIAFITNNKTDFSDDGGHHIHPDLQQDISDLDLNSKCVVLFDDLSQFYEKHIKPSLADTLADVKRQLQEHTFGQLNLLDWLSDNADTLLAGRSWTPHELGLPWYFENPVFSAVVTMPEISVLDVRQIDSGEILVEARSNLACEFDFLMAKLEYYTTAVEDSTFVNGLYISDADWNDHYVAASATITIGAIVFLTFDPVRGEITSSDVRDLQVNPEPLANDNLI